MVQGTMSGAGKSLIAAALCRIFRQDGLSAAPFKSQNMALNSYITREGLEMGRAQVVQAQAAGIEPDVRMNPILLKPSSDTGSQLIVNGEVRGEYRAADYFKMKKSLIPEVLAAYESLAVEHDVIIIEGAGSPAEINLRQDDIVNMGLARLVDAPVILVGDIDRGGVFAQLYGTAALLEEEERRRIVGLVINKFRGDEGLLRPGLTMLEEKTGIPVLGVIPYAQVDIDDEDSLSPRLGRRAHRKAVDVAVVRLPHISNFTDFAPLERHPALGVRYVGRPDLLAGADLIILPGTTTGCGRAAWRARSKSWPPPGPRCWGCAGAIRCWESVSPTRMGWRGAARWRALVCCPATPSLPPKRPAPEWRRRCPPPALGGHGSAAMRSTWASPSGSEESPSPASPTAGRRGRRRETALAPISTACLTRGSW